jgi:hypothetical protein
MEAEEALDWYRRQKARDQTSRDRSDSLLGHEKTIFLEAMDLMVKHFDAVLTAPGAHALLDDLAFKRKISLIHYGFNLLWSAWDETMAGRYQTAADHWRSIDECPDFLFALEINPPLADQMTDATTIKVETARKTIHKALNSGTESGHLMQQQKQHKDLQALSHVSVQSLGQHLPVREIGVERRSLVQLGGAVAPLTLRLHAIHLALSALTLQSAALFAFEKTVQIEHELWQITIDRIANRGAVLQNELEGLREATFPSAAGVYMARSDEDP